ncbi:MAG: SDR family NAD(P)-dependent oxidoreductase [Actinomycetota bacterium]|nr:SDR family oxidoreductase [Actinomycetota bacterium]
MDVGAAFDLSGKTAAVTGAASGIGRSTAEALASAGANVLCGDINETGATETVALITEAGGKALAQRMDVTNKADVDAFVDRAVAEFGRLDVMANVAGVAADGRIAEATEDMLDRAIAINLKGVFFGCQAAVRVMQPQGSGSIINVSSSIIDAPAPAYGLYGMTKAAVAHLTMTLSREVGRYGIRVNTLAPGMTITEFTTRHVYEADGTVNQEKYDAFVNQMRKLSPLGLVGEPADQAYLIVFLASDAAKFCTGQIWRANGGQTTAW